MKVASRTRSGVGRVVDPSGATSLRPRADPEITRIAATVAKSPPLRSPDDLGAARRRGGGADRPGPRAQRGEQRDRRAAARRRSSPSTPTTSLRVAVLTGDEQAFSAGANLRDLPRLRDSGPLGPTRLQLGKPVIAAIEGWCVAGGVELAAWCDLRVAGASARDRLPRAPVGRAAHRRRHLPAAADRRARPGARPHPHRARDRRRGGRAHRASSTASCPTARPSPTAVALAGEIAAFPWLGVVNDRKSVYAGLGLGRSTRPSPSRTSSAARRSSPTASARASTGSTTTKPSATADRPRLWTNRPRDSPTEDPTRQGAGGRARCMPPCAVQLLVRQSSPSTRCDAGAVDVVGEEVRAAEVAHVEAARGRGTSCAPAPIVGVVDLAARQKSLASPARSSLSASGVMMQQRGSRRRSWAFTALGMLPGVEAAVAQERLPRADPRPAVRSGRGHQAQAVVSRRPGRSRRWTGRRTRARRR